MTSNASQQGCTALDVIYSIAREDFWTREGCISEQRVSAYTRTKDNVGQTCLPPIPRSKDEKGTSMCSAAVFKKKSLGKKKHELFSA